MSETFSSETFSSEDLKTLSTLFGKMKNYRVKQAEFRKKKEEAEAKVAEITIHLEENKKSLEFCEKQTEQARKDVVETEEKLKVVAPLLSHYSNDVV